MCSPLALPSGIADLAKLADISHVRRTMTVFCLAMWVRDRPDPVRAEVADQPRQEITAPLKRSCRALQTGGACPQAQEMQ